jgi:hypothetical protein
LWTLREIKYNKKGQVMKVKGVLLGKEKGERKGTERREEKKKK